MNVEQIIYKRNSFDIERELSLKAFVEDRLSADSLGELEQIVSEVDNIKSALARLLSIMVNDEKLNEDEFCYIATGMKPFEYPNEKGKWPQITFIKEKSCTN